MVAGSPAAGAELCAVGEQIREAITIPATPATGGEMATKPGGIGRRHTAFLQWSMKSGTSRHSIRNICMIVSGSRLAKWPVVLCCPAEICWRSVIYQFVPWLWANPTSSSTSEVIVWAAGISFEAYKEHVVKTVLSRSFLQFDRQIVLVDCLQPLKISRDAIYDLRDTLGQLQKLSVW